MRTLKRYILIAIPLVLLGGPLSVGLMAQDDSGSAPPPDTSQPVQKDEDSIAPAEAPQQNDSSQQTPQQNADPNAQAPQQNDPNNPSAQQTPAQSNSVPSSQGTVPAPSQATPAVRPRTAPTSEQTVRPATPEDDKLFSCFWITDRTSVRIGEHLRLKLTCEVNNTKTRRVDYKEQMFEPSAINLEPFEIKGEDSEKNTKGDTTHIQHVYTGWLSGDAFFGKEVKLPNVDFTYSVTELTASGEAMGMRDVRYRMPGLSMKIQSLVPEKSTDIRDSTWRTLSDVPRRRFRANIGFILSGFLGAVACAIFGMWVFSTTRNGERKSKAAKGEGFRVPGLVSKLISCGNELRNTGLWDQESVNKLLALMRATCALSLGLPVAQKVRDAKDKGLEGELRFPKGTWRKRSHVVVFSSFTPEDMGRAEGHDPALLAAFSEVNDARYLSDALSQTELDRALVKAIATLCALRQKYGWLAKLRRRMGWKS